MKLIKEVYGDEYAGAKTPGQKQALAKKLMKKADDTQNDPANKYVILKVAKDVATQAADVETAFAAVDAIAQSFDVNPIEAKAGVLTLVAKNARLPPEHTAVAKQSLALVDPALAKDEFDLAARLGELALAEARLARGPKLVQQIEEQIAQIQEQSRAYEDVKKFASILEQKPTDPEANLAVGKYRCFTKGDWDQGIPMLALGSDEELKALAMKELQGPASSDEQVKLGDGWWKVAEKQTEAVQRPIKGRAGYWYRKAAPLLSGVMKDKVEKRLRETEKESVAPGEPPEPPEDAKATPAIAGLFQVGLQEQKTRNARTRFWDFRADNSLWEKGNQIARWTADGARVLVDFSDKSWHRLVLQRKGKGGKGLLVGTYKYQNRETWSCELQPIFVVAVWQHQAAGNKPGNMMFWSNGHLHTPDGNGTWELNGSKLTLRQPPWVDNYALSPDGQSYEGRNQRGTHISGKLISGSLQPNP